MTEPGNEPMVNLPGLSLSRYRGSEARLDYDKSRACMPVLNIRALLYIGIGTDGQPIHELCVFGHESGSEMQVPLDRGWRVACERANQIAESCGYLASWHRVDGDDRQFMLHLYVGGCKYSLMFHEDEQSSRVLSVTLYDHESDGDLLSRWIPRLEPAYAPEFRDETVKEVQEFSDSERE